ncbi:hypothetical protein H4V97_000826 [Flavobacterium sp. CG_23.5]|uniref:hypothetical protein n=1 Tax=Flavobacterium sp. CG_23.5 TaxID=2760708 RepID=UPI001AE8C161|nr:hypothetical protein [Flavobacterium sp. CG_23.5]MBP2282508.1 hypothetical protein [Flavobacterium sp. CG_23.5]
MLINLGRNIKILKTGIIENASCPNCNKINTLNFSIYGGYINVIIIPSAPIKRTILVECSNCKKTYKLKELTPEINTNFKEQYKKNPVKNPLWQYTGSIILAVTLSFAIYTGIQMKKAEKQYIINPLIGDIYRVNNDGHYSTLKVKKVSNDTISIYINDMETNTYSGIDEINIDKNYNKTQFFTKQNLRDLYTKNIIYQIDRR